MKRYELVATLSAATIGTGFFSAVLKHELDKLPGSYSEQIQQSLGLAGIKATGLNLDSEKGKFSFKTNDAGEQDTCIGSYWSEDHINVDIDPSINCKATDGEPNPVIAVE